MKWSKLKKIAESLLADSLKGRIKYHIAKYGPGETALMSRGWITLDGTEIANFSNIETWNSERSLAHQINALSKGPSTPDSPDAWGQAQTLLKKQGIFSRDQFYLALEDYVQLTIDAALLSSNEIVRAFAVFDRRCGKRRLESLKPPAYASSLLKDFYRIRCDAEGLPLTT